MTAEQYIAENKRRLAAINAPYDQITGLGCTACPRSKVNIADYYDGQDIYLPDTMLEDSFIRAIVKAGAFSAFLVNNGVQSENDITSLAYIFNSIRFKYDFEYWSATCWNIEIKLSEKSLQDGTAGTFAPLILNRGQRKVLAEIYDDMYHNRPIRHVVCKCRQWGCSTFYSAVCGWFQNVLFVKYNSVVVAHVENAARLIRGMFVNAVARYPYIFMGANAPLELTPYQGSQKTRYLQQRDYRISIGSSVKPDGIRSENINIAHFSEVAYYESTPQRTPEALTNSISNSVPLLPNTLIVYESTPNGTGNFFHREYVRAKKGQSNFKAIFIAWFDIDIYTIEIPDYKKFIASLSQKEKYIFSLGATLEAIAWYREKSKEQQDEWRFISDFPSDDVEAFQSSGRLVFDIKDVERLRQGCRPPATIGEVVGNALEGREALEGLHFVPSVDGKLKVWTLPSKEPVSNRYAVIVDIGVGLSEEADNSIICVIDRYYMLEGGVPEVVAEWSGHLPKDIVVWKAVQMAKFYCNALLVVEKNSIVPRATDYSQFILETIVLIYSNIYTHTPIDQVRRGIRPKYGYHTNHTSKLAFITFFKKVLREDMYYEPCLEAVNEIGTLEHTVKGTYEAIEGNRDDRAITRCIGMDVVYNKMPAVTLIDNYTNNNNKNTDYRNEATFF
nr:MAG TPA: Terminase large subunit [Caudoviricetes sp.]